MPLNKDSLSAIILCAGLSERMGRPKHNLKFTRDESFSEHLIKVFQSTCSNIILVVNKNFVSSLGANKETVSLVVNPNPEIGRTSSIRLGLEKVKLGNYCFIHNVDNPFVDETLLENLLRNSDKDSYTTPEYKEKGGHPILLGSGLIPYLMDEKNDMVSFQELLSEHDRIKVEYDNDHILRNINTDADYKKYFNLG